MKSLRPYFVFGLFAVSSFQLQARTFEIAFDINVSNHVTSSTGQAGKQIDSTFVPGNFLYTIRFSDNPDNTASYGISCSPLWPSCIPVNMGTQALIEENSTTPFSILNEYTPTFSGFESNDPLKIRGEYRQMSGSPTGLYSPNLIIQLNTWMTSSITESNKINKSISNCTEEIPEGMFCADNKVFNFEKYFSLTSNSLVENKTLSQANADFPLTSIEGLLALYTNHKNNGTAFNFTQGLKESIENTLVTCTPAPTPTDPYAMSCSPAYDFYHSDEYTGTATIASIAEVSEVPVPGAMWLMGSGLMGLAAIKKRRK